MADRGMVIIATRAGAARQQGVFYYYRWHLEGLDDLLAASLETDESAEERIYTGGRDRVELLVRKFTGLLVPMAPFDGFEEVVHALRLDDLEIESFNVALEDDFSRVWTWLRQEEKPC